MNSASSSEKLLQSPEEASARVREWKRTGYRVVFTNGCFDILHRGHVDLLSRAAAYGDRLIVGLNSDHSVRRLEKGEERPINDEGARAEVLASLSFVDGVVLFEEDTPEALISKLIPDVLVKGGDYTKDELAGSKLVEENGGEVILLPLLEGYSTSSIVERILGSRKDG